MQNWREYMSQIIDRIRHELWKREAWMMEQKDINEGTDRQE